MALTSEIFVFQDLSPTNEGIGLAYPTTIAINNQAHFLKSPEAPCNSDFT